MDRGRAFQCRGPWSGRGCSWVFHVGQRRAEGALEVAVDDATVVEVVDGIEDGADDGGVVLGIAPGEDAVKELAAGGELKGEVVLGAGLEALVECDLGG